MIARLLHFEPLWVVCLAPFVLLPGRWLPGAWQPVVVAALFVGWPLRWLATRRLLPAAPLHVALGALLLWLPVNIWAAVDVVVAWQAAGYLLLGVAGYGAAIAWPPLQRQPQLLAWLLVALAGVLALAGPLLAAPDTTWPLIGPLQQMAAPLAVRLGETINPNILAGAIVVLLPLIVALAVGALDAAAPRRFNRWLRALLWVLAGVIVAVVTLAASRGALLGIGAGLLVVVLWRWPRLLWATPLVLLALVGVLMWVGPTTLLSQPGSGGAVGGLDERLEIWSRGLYALQDFAFTGVGLGHFNRVIPLLYPYFLISPSVDISHAHNLVLQVGVDLGIPGLVAWLAMLIAVFVLLGRVLYRRPHNVTTTLAAGVLGGLAAMLVHGVLDAPLWGAKLAFTPWLLFALAILLERQQQPGEQ
jgi:putative inorganic carbon (HCO3(-)) transporter